MPLWSFFLRVFPFDFEEPTVAAGRLSEPIESK